MRFVCDIFADGKRRIAETTVEGDFVTYLEDQQNARKYQRIAAYLELACDDNKAGVDKLIKALDDIKLEIQNRKKKMIALRR